MPAPPSDVLLPQTRREHRHTTLDAFDGLELDLPELADARAWMLEHVDAHDPPTLVHGDLLGQNILRRFDGDSPSFGVIDWEYAQVGDPAHDLAILTRGSQRPFGVPDGLPRLLDAYNARGKIPLGRADVRFFELALTVSVYADMLEAEGPHTPPGHVLRTIARLVKQAAAWG